MNPFAQPASSLQEILNLIQQIPMGKKVVLRFDALRDSGKLKVCAYPRALRDELLAVQTPGTPMGAVFVTNGEEGQILYDSEGELGVLVSFIFHEIIHSLDARLWKGAEKTLSAEERNELVYSSECLAFSEQHKFQEGLKKNYPELRQFHEIHYPQLDFLNRALSSQEIRNLYNLVSK